MQNVFVHNHGQHMHRAIGSTTCGKHKADIGMPCWVLPNSKDVDKFHYGICGKRILKAGFIGKVSPQSMRAKAPAKQTDGERKPFKKKFNNRQFAPTSK